MTDPATSVLVGAALRFGTGRLRKRLNAFLDDSQGFTELSNLLGNHLVEHGHIAERSGAFDRRRLLTWARTHEVRMALLNPQSDEIVALSDGLADCWRSPAHLPSHLSDEAAADAAGVFHAAILFLALPADERSTVVYARQHAELVDELQQVAANVQSLRASLDATSGPPAGDESLVPLEPAIVPPGTHAAPTEQILSRSGLLPLVGRVGEMEQLLGWIDKDEPFSAFIVKTAEPYRSCRRVCPSYEDQRVLLVRRRASDRRRRTPQVSTAGSGPGCLPAGREPASALSVPVQRRPELRDGAHGVAAVAVSAAAHQKVGVRPGPNRLRVDELLREPLKLLHHLRSDFAR